MSVIKKLFTVEGITASVLLFIGYKAIVIAMETAAWLKTALAVG